MNVAVPQYRAKLWRYFGVPMHIVGILRASVGGYWAFTPIKIIIVFPAVVFGIAIGPPLVAMCMIWSTGMVAGVPTEGRGVPSRLVMVVGIH
jgi:hypothetical protein